MKWTKTAAGKNSTGMDVIPGMMVILLAAAAVLIVLSGSRKEENKTEGTISGEKPAVSTGPIKPEPSDLEDAVICDFPAQGRVTESGVRFRTEPDIRTGQILEELSAGTKVTVISEKDGWYLVRLNDMSGYVYAEYILLQNK